MATTRTTGRRESKPADDEEFLHQLYRGGELLSTGKVIEAKEHLEKAFKLQPKNEKGQNLLGLTYFKLGLFDRAAEIYESLVQDNPADPTLRVNLGLVYLKTNALQRATREFETATDLDPDHRKAQNYLGLALAQAGEYGRAREHFVLAGSDAMAEKMSRAIAGESFERPPPVQPVRQSGFSEIEGRDVVAEHGGEHVESASTLEQSQSELAESGSESDGVSNAEGELGAHDALGTDDALGAHDALATDDALGTDDALASEDMLGSDTGLQPDGALESDSLGGVNGAIPGHSEPLPTEWSDASPAPESELAVGGEGEPLEVAPDPEDVHDEVMGDTIPLAAQVDAGIDDQDWGAEFTEQSLAPPEIEPLEPVPEPEVDPTTLDPVPVDPDDILLEATPDDEVGAADVETPVHALAAASSMPPPAPIEDDDVTSTDRSSELAAEHSSDAEELELTGHDDAVSRGAYDESSFSDIAAEPLDGEVTPIPSGISPELEHASSEPDSEAEVTATGHSIMDDSIDTPVGEPTALGDVLPRTRSSGVAPEHILPLVDLAPSLQLFQGALDGPFHLGAECAAIVVRDEMLTRLHGVLAVSGQLQFEPEMRRVRGRASDKPFGDGDRRVLRARGEGVILVGPEDQKFVAVELGDESGYFREETVFAFEEPLMFENGRVPSEGGPDLELVHLRGKGRVLLRIFGALRSWEVTMSRPAIIPAPHLVGWYGNLTPRVVPLVKDGKGKTSRSGVELSGEGFALIAVALG